MVVSDNGELNITGDMEASGGLRLNNNRQKLRQRFDIVRKLGQGTYGKVQLALNKDTGEEVAIKTIKKAKIETEQDLVRIQREIQIMSSVQHPHIIHIYEVFENKEKIVLVMEYANGGELYDYLSYKKSLGECEARRLFRQIVSAVYYCHKNKICHRDLKLENILLDEKGNTKIADFGLSNVFDEQRKLSTFCGSPLYASPEIVKGTPYYGPEVDCWSLGVLLYTLVYGAMPFDGSNFRRLVKQISEGDYYEPKQPSEASSLIRRMLTVVPSKRATIEEVCTDWWVNLGYQDSLLTVAEEMCQAMPVRLDYLLQLVPPTILQSAVTCNESITETEKPVAVAKDLVETQSLEKEMVEDDVKSSLMDETLKPMEAEEATATAESTTRKHKLTSSTKSLISDSNEKLGTCKKKQKKVDKQDNAVIKMESNVEANVTEQNISSEEIQPEPLQAEVKSEQVEPIEGNTCKEIATEVGITEGSNKELKKDSKAEVKSKVTDVEGEKNSESSSTELATGKTKIPAEPEHATKQTKSSKGEKTKKGQAKSSQKTLETSKDKLIEKTVPPAVEPDQTKAESTTEESKVEDGEEKKKPAKTKGTKNINATKSEIEVPTLTSISRRGSKSLDEKKLLFPALKVSEARKAFEIKPAEKKSLVIPGLKVSAARKAFESPTVNTNSAASTVSKSIPIKTTSVKTKESSTVTVNSVTTNDNLQKNKNNEPEISEQPAIKTDYNKDVKEYKEIKEDKEGKEIKESKAEMKEEKTQPEIKNEEGGVTESKDSSPVHPQKITGFVPTLDVSMAVKPSKRTVGKPPAAPRTVADTSGTSSGENTPDVSKISSSPFPKAGLRKASITKSLSNSKETSGLISSSSSSPDNDDETRKKFQGASSKDICGSESSFLARAFMNKNSDASVPLPSEASSSLAEGKLKSASENGLSNSKSQKISSVEIQINSGSEEKLQASKSVESPTKSAEPTVEFTEPQPTLVRSSTPGKFTLLGVTSEVCFNVDAPAEEPITAALPATSHTQQSLYMNVTLPPPPPASPSPEIINAKDSQKNISSPPKTPEKASGNASKERIIPVQLDSSKSESSQQGYNVYRSKFCNSYSSRLGESSKYRAPSLERSESLSSTGSIDDLEDSFFDSVAGDSMLSGILARTRSILEEFTRDDSSRRFGSIFSRTGASSGSTSYRSDPFRDSFPKRDWFSDITSGFGSRLSRDTSDSFSSRTRSSKAWRSSGASHSSAQDNEAYLSDSGLRTRKKKNNLPFFGPDDDYMSDSSARSRRSAYSSSYSRSISRSISEEESHSVSSNSRSASYSSSIDKNSINNDNPSSFIRSVSRESSQQEASSNNSSRSDCQRRSSWSNRATPVSSLESGSSTATVAYTSREKDGYNNNGSSNYYKYDTKGNEDHLSRRRSLHSKELKDEPRSRSRSCFESALNEITSLYGTIRRPRSLLRYSKSLTKDELGNRRSSSIDDFDDLEEKLLKRMHRPRSILVLTDPDGDNREEDDSSASSDPPRDRFRFSRDDMSRGGGSSGNQRSSRRDGAGRGPNSANTKTNFNANSYESKSQGYPVNEAKDIGSDFKFSSGYKKKLINSDEAKKKPQPSSVSAMTTEQMQERNFSANNESSQISQESSSLNVKENTNEEEKKIDNLVTDESEIDMKTGAAGYWAKRYGSNSRMMPCSKNLQKAKEFFQTSKQNETENCSKFDDNWIESNSVKNEVKSVPNDKSHEASIIGFARSITNELDQLQVDLSQRFGSQMYPYDESSRPRRRYSISGNEISSKIFPSQKTSEGNHPSDVVPVITPFSNGGTVGCSSNANNSCKHQNSSFIKDDAVESSGSTPTPTPTPIPVQNQTLHTNNDKIYKSQPNGYLSLTSEDEMSTPTEADDSCSVCSDTNETAAARRSPCMEEESVSERIRRKSYFARFHDNRSRKHHQSHHRKSLDVNRNHHMGRLDDYSLLPAEPIGRPFHSHENSHISGRRNSISHEVLDANDDDGNYPTLTRKSARHKHSSLPRNTAIISSDDKYECDHSLPSTSCTQPLNDITSEDGDQQINYSNSVQKTESPSVLSNGYSDTTSRALSPSTKMFSCPVSPKLTRHLSLIDDNVDTSSISRPITSSYNFDRRKTSSPLDACSQSRAKIRSRHDYIINRALSSIDEGMGITRPYSPTSRLSLIDNQLSDLRRFSAVLDNSSPRDVIRKALDVCNSLQY